MNPRKITRVEYFINVCAKGLEICINILFYNICIILFTMQIEYVDIFVPGIKKNAEAQTV
jgi:hypothetical protein